MSSDKRKILNTAITDGYCCAHYVKMIKMPDESLLPLLLLALLRNFQVIRRIDNVRGTLKEQTFLVLKWLSYYLSFAFLPFQTLT